MYWGGHSLFLSMCTKSSYSCYIIAIPARLDALDSYPLPEIAHSRSPHLTALSNAMHGGESAKSRRHGGVVWMVVNERRPEGPEWGPWDSWKALAISTALGGSCPVTTIHPLIPKAPKKERRRRAMAPLQGGRGVGPGPANESRPHGSLGLAAWGRSCWQSPTDDAESHD